ncbi:hypothetical protein AB0J52_10795 [Spirillospora sp. NPDC049652]
MRRFRRDPLVVLDGLWRRSADPVFALPWGGWCVGDTGLALSVLRDSMFHGGGASFFGGRPSSCPEQVAVGRGVRAILRGYLPTYCDRIRRAAATLPQTSRWPMTGPVLVHQAARDVLLHPDAPPRLRWLMDRAAGSGPAIQPVTVRQRARAELLGPRVRRPPPSMCGTGAATPATPRRVICWTR